MFAVILAGGFGTRLRSVVCNVPKPLALVNGRPFLEYVIKNAKLMGIKQIILCLYYMKEKIQEYFQDGARWGVQIIYSVEERPLGTGGAVGLLRNVIDSTFCVINGDTYLNLDLQKCLTEHKRKAATATIALTNVKEPGRYGQVQLDRSSYIKGFVEKSSHGGFQGYINAGLYLLEPEIFRYIKEDSFVSLEKDVFPVIVSAGKRIAGYPAVKNFFDIGTPEDYRLFCKWLTN